MQKDASGTDVYQKDVAFVGFKASTDPTPPSGDEATYTLTLADNQSKGGAVAAETEVTVKVGDGTVQTVAVGADGSITFKGPAAGGEQSLTITAPGYVKATQTVTLPENGGAVTGGVTLAQQTTDVTLGVETVPAIVTLKAKGNDTVTALMQDQLPMSASATDENNKVVTLHGLPDGVYEYTVEEAGKEPVTKTLVVANSGLMSDVTDAALGNTSGTPTTGKIGIVDPSKPSEEPTMLDVTSGAATATAAESGSADATDITAPLYIVEGTWAKTGDAVTGMTMKVYLKNTDAISGTFGMHVDSAVFQTVTNKGVVFNASGVELVANAKVPSLQLGKDYVGFQWTVVDDGENGGAVAGKAAKTLLATIDLEFTDKAKSDYKDMITKDTLRELPFVGSAWETQIKDAFGEADTASVAAYWRHVDDENKEPLGDGRLLDTVAKNGGFYQTVDVNANNEITGDQYSQDTRMQFLYEVTSDKVPVTFKVVDSGDETHVLSGATVTVKDEAGNTLGVVTTGADGTGTIYIKEQPVDYTASLDGYTDKGGTVPADKLNETVLVKLTSENGHPVEIAADWQAKIALVGNKQAPNKVNYCFSLDAQPGYEWPGDKLPDANKLEIKWLDAEGNEVTGNTALTATWDAAMNAYVIDSNLITDPEMSHKIVIGLSTDGESQQPTPENVQYKVTTTVGNNGKVEYTEVPAGNTMGKDNAAATSPVTGPATLVETLKAGTADAAAGTTSAKYTFTPEKPYVSDGEDDPYNAYVIESVKVNGSELTLTDAQKINGLQNFQLTGIDKDQSVVVTFAKAHVTGNVIDPVPTPEPTNEKANVTLILSPYGTGSVKVNDATSATEQLQDTTVNYEVEIPTGKKTGSFTATFAGMTDVVQPANEGDGAEVKVNYVIDSVTVDGVKVNGDPAGTGWNGTSSTLTLGKLKAGENHTVIVTFAKAPANPDDKPDPMFATLEIIRRAGEGTVEPMGIQTATVGLPVDVEITPAANYNLNQIDLTKPEAVAEDVTEDAGEPVEGTYNYQVPALEAGKTVLGVTFASTEEGTRYQVTMKVVYGGEETKPGAKATAATFTFTNTETGYDMVYGPNGAGAVDQGGYHLDGPGESGTQVYTFNLPAGTWNVRITKNGYLNYTINGFTIAKDGETITAGVKGTDNTGMDTKVDTTTTEGVTTTTIHFGQKKDETEQKPVTLTIGDATWDGDVINLNDISQVSRGMIQNALAILKKRADVDESGDVKVADMTCVVDNYAARQVSTTYADFMTPAVQP